MATQLQYLGFSPTTELRELVQNRLNQILDECPSDASAIFELVLSKSGFEGLLKVHALAGAFAAKAIKADPGATLDSLVEDIRAQVGRWKKLRVLPS